MQFFISPLISEDGVEREVKAVDSECAFHLNQSTTSVPAMQARLLPYMQPTVEIVQVTMTKSDTATIEQ